MKQHILILLGLAVFCLQSANADSWQIIASPNGPRQVNELHSVSALSENDVWAVGVSYNTELTLGSTLIEHWNGSRWSVVPSPNPSSSVNKLNAVAAVSPNDVWASGDRSHWRRHSFDSSLERRGLECGLKSYHWHTFDQSGCPYGDLGERYLGGRKRRDRG